MLLVQNRGLRFVVVREKGLFACNFTGFGVFCLPKPLFPNALLGLILLLLLLLLRLLLLIIIILLLFLLIFFLFLFLLLYLLFPCSSCSSLSILSTFHFLSSPSSFSCFLLSFSIVLLFVFIASLFPSFELHYIQIPSSNLSYFNLNYFLFSCHFYFFSRLCFLLLLFLYKPFSVQVRGCNKTINKLFSTMWQVSVLGLPMLPLFKCDSLKTIQSGFRENWNSTFW